MYFAVLREHGVAHVFNSWTRMPPIGDQLDLPGALSGPFIVARALLQQGRTYDEAVDAFAPYDRIQDPSPALRRDLVRLIETAVRDPHPRLSARQQPRGGQRAAHDRRGAPNAAAGGRVTVDERASLRRYAVLSIVAALATIALKGGAYLITGSIGLLSDALESLVNLAAAIVAFIALSAAARPEDEEHAYGHSKAEYFSSGFEGALILLAAASIVYTVGRAAAVAAADRARPASASRIIARRPRSSTSWSPSVLFRAGRRHESITLEADAHHLMADVWTSVGSHRGRRRGGAHRVAPARLRSSPSSVAINIVRTGVKLLRRSMLGLLDTALPETSSSARSPRSWRRHARRACGSTRSAPARPAPGASSFPHPGAGELDGAAGPRPARADRGGSARGRAQQRVDTHLEPIEDPASFADVAWSGTGHQARLGRADRRKAAVSARSSARPPLSRAQRGTYSAAIELRVSRSLAPLGMTVVIG